MALPTPNYQFFTTDNVLYDAISGTDFLAQNNVSYPAVNSLLEIDGENKDCVFISSSTSTRLLKKDNLNTNNSKFTISFWYVSTTVHGTFDMGGPLFISYAGTPTSSTPVFSIAVKYFKNQDIVAFTVFSK
jgi:hypothetical protein